MNNITLNDLKIIAKELKIPGIMKMNKMELYEKVLEYKELTETQREFISIPMHDLRSYATSIGIYGVRNFRKKNKIELVNLIIEFSDIK